MVGVADRVRSRTLVRGWLGDAVSRSGMPIKGVAKATGTTRQKLHAMLRGTQRVDVVTLLGMPETIRDEVLARVAEECGRELVLCSDAWRDGGWDDMRRTLWDVFADFYRKLQDVRGHVTAGKAAQLRPLARRLREIATAVEVLCDKAERERVVSVEEVSK